MTTFKAVDAFVETSIDGVTWKRASDPNPDFAWFDGPWSVAEAVEVGRAIRAAFVRVARAYQHEPTVHVRVIDTAGVIVQQWPSL